MKHILRAWQLDQAPCTLHAVRENRVYCIGSPARFALRHHRPNLRTISQIQAELTWMTALGDQGLPVPHPVPTLAGSLILEHEGQLYSLITWLPGTPLGYRQTPLDLKKPEQIFFNLGQLLKQLHTLPGPADLDRPDWTRQALLGEAPLWGPFWNHPHLRTRERHMVLEFREYARNTLAQKNLPHQLIHADLLQENVLVKGTQISLIDFDDCAYGYRAFDLVTPLVQRLINPEFADLRDALLTGYGPADREDLALFLVVRCLTYVGWICDKMDTPEGQAMSGRILTRALKQTRAYLSGHSPML